jgi:hypothetical protein
MHRGYADLIRIANVQLESRKQKVFLNPLKAMDEVLEQEYAKGEISGIALFTKIIDVQIAELEREINQKLEDHEHERPDTASSQPVFDGSSNNDEFFNDYGN